jgi:glycosyltransferase involved in cell wall biosynthesis
LIDRINILQIGKYFNPDKGGIETVTEGISTALLSEDIVADVLCFARERPYETAHLPYKIMRARPNLELGNKALSVDYYRQIAALSDNYDAALMHLPNPLAMLGALAGWRKPLILIWHADILPYKLLSPFIRILERASIRQATAVISPTAMHTEGSYLAEALAPKREVIPYPFFADRLPDADASAPEVRAIEAFLRGRRLVLAVGRLVPYKGFDVLVDASLTLDPSAAIVIVGTGPMAKALDSQARQMGTLDKVFFAGHVGDAALAALYERAAVVTMSSVTRAEMYGMTQVEAMSYGVPVVSTIIPRSGVPLVNINDVTGLTVPPNDAVALSAALSRILTEPDTRNRLGDGGRRLCAEIHDSRQAGRRYAQLIRRVVAGATALG